MRYVLGMAKSAENGKGSKGRNLELDFLRLHCAVLSLRGTGCQAIGYIAVVSRLLQNMIERWKIKYGAIGNVNVYLVSLSAGEKIRFDAEKGNNRRGNTYGADPSLAYATFSCTLTETALRKHIMESERNVVLLDRTAAAPFGIRWDFFASADETA